MILNGLGNGKSTQNKLNSTLSQQIKLQNNKNCQSSNMLSQVAPVNNINKLTPQTSSNQCNLNSGMSDKIIHAEGKSLADYNILQNKPTINGVAIEGKIEIWFMTEQEVIDLVNKFDWGV